MHMEIFKPIFNQFLPFDFINNNLLFFLNIYFIGDFVSYLSHGISHKFFWELHEFHHSATEMTMFNFIEMVY